MVNKDTRGDGGDEPPFSKKDQADGAALLKAKGVAQVLFSEGTYQVEIKENKKSYWPFLQLDDAGHVVDCFCTCTQGEKSCAHLAAAYQKISQKDKAPLHVRFRGSLWNALCQMASRRHGYQVAGLQETKAGFEAYSATKKCLFSVEGHTTAAKKKLQEMLFERAPETEETSLKFSNLSPEELALWKQGRPSHTLSYELSFWSDLAKWCMNLQDDGQKYTIAFEGEMRKLPWWITIRFAQLSVGCYIAEVNWPHIIPPLATVTSPLRVHEFLQNKIGSIRYDAARRAFLIKSTQLKEQSAMLPKGDAIPVGDWLFLPKKGFFPSQIDPLFNQGEIPAEKIAFVLNKHSHIIHKYLVGTKLHTTSVPAQYTIFFDKQERLHIQCSVFERGDLSQPHSALFGSWAYIEGKGFYLLENLLFEGHEKIIPREQISAFINRHRVWLNGFEGYQTHVYTIESQLHFQLSPTEGLHFEAALELKEMGHEFIDFGEWIYLKGKGFFAKKWGKGGAHIHAGLHVPKDAISSFIDAHKEELEALQGFFTDNSPLEKCGVTVSLAANNVITVHPQFTFRQAYRQRDVLLFGDYTYVLGEGFCAIPAVKRLPAAFWKERIIQPEDESYFVLYELDILKSFILSIDKELIKPRHLGIHIRQMKKTTKAKTIEWLLDASLHSELGEVSLFEVWQALVENRKYFFSPAGLIVLRPPRFNWLKGISKRKWQQGGKFLKLSTMDWIRLSVLEDVLPPQGTSAEATKTRLHLETLHTFKTDLPIDLTDFKSELRNYQELGVRWLYFLHAHGLSGLLCDEMGLGKTHQAMGLLATAKNQGMPQAKFLVVCPTSVIYHWEDLLKRFLPTFRITVFYGIGRTLEHFAEHADLLLTSYGTLRSEIEALSHIPFTIAIFDEIQIAKNTQSQTHKALKKIDAAMRLGLTGTPIENRLLELKALFDVILPGYMPQEAQFKEYFVNPIEKGQDPERKVLLSRLIKPFILRRKKAEVLLELPEKIEEIAYCALSEEQWELYTKTVARHKDALLREIEREDAPLPFMHVFSLFSTLKQICDHPCLITKRFDEFQKHKSGKWDLFVELLEETRDSGQKLVIFSQYLDMLNMMESYLKEHKIGYAGIRGNTRDRKEQLERFKTDPHCEVFLASLQAAGVGIDLVSASVVIHYDRWWNPARENQATDRVHRIGQNRGVQVFKMVSKGTIEEHIHRMIQRKLSLLEEVISFDDQNEIKGFDRKDLLELLRALSEKEEGS